MSVRSGIVGCIWKWDRVVAGENHIMVNPQVLVESTGSIFSGEKKHDSQEKKIEEFLINSSVNESTP